MKQFIFITIFIILTSSCSTHRNVEYGNIRASTDTIRVISHVRDTISIRDTVREKIREKGDTVEITREIVRWREKASRMRDTLFRTRTDTIFKTRTETVEIEKPRSFKNTMFPFFTGIAAGVCAMILVLKKKG